MTNELGRKILELFPKSIEVAGNVAYEVRQRFYSLLSPAAPEYDISISNQIVEALAQAMYECAPERDCGLTPDWPWDRTGADVRSEYRAEAILFLTGNKKRQPPAEKPAPDILAIAQRNPDLHQEVIRLISRDFLYAPGNEWVDAGILLEALFNLVGKSTVTGLMLWKDFDDQPENIRDEWFDEARKRMGLPIAKTEVPGVPEVALTGAALERDKEFEKAQEIAAAEEKAAESEIDIREAAKNRGIYAGVDMPGELLEMAAIRFEELVHHALGWDKDLPAEVLAKTIWDISCGEPGKPGYSNVRFDELPPLVRIAHIGAASGKIYAAQMAAANTAELASAVKTAVDEAAPAFTPVADLSPKPEMKDYRWPYEKIDASDSVKRMAYALLDIRLDSNDLRGGKYPADWDVECLAEAIYRAGRENMHSSRPFLSISANARSTWMERAKLLLVDVKESKSVADYGPEAVAGLEVFTQAELQAARKCKPQEIGGTHYQQAELQAARKCKPQEIGGTHYQQGLKTSPWDLQKEMPTSGNAFVDARCADAIKYAFRRKGSAEKKLEDMKKARHCLEAAIAEYEKFITK